MTINLDEFSIINGKKYKKCKSNQIRNPNTNRCNKIKIVKKSKTFINLKAKKIQKLFLPFINRVSGNIEDRIHYYFMIKKFLNIHNNSKKCLEIYKYINEKPIYRIGNNIILKKQIGSQSAHGIVFLSTFRDKNKKLFKYACKLTMNNLASEKDNEIQEKLTKSITKCPHFPILYGTIECNYLLNKDSYIKSNSKDNNIIGKFIDYPKIIQNAKLFNKTVLITFNELANGDLNSYINTERFFKSEELYNCLTQIYLSLMFYYQEIKMLHCDAHSGNFLYHKIKKGGYFHYNLFGIDYYIKNIGYLWIIWDFELSLPFDKNKYLLNGDFKYIINEFMPKKKLNKNHIEGWNINTHYKINNIAINKIQEIYKELFKAPIKYNNNDIKDVCKTIINVLRKNKFLLTKIPLNAIILNKTPYTLK